MQVAYVQEKILEKSPPAGIIHKKPKANHDQGLLTAVCTGYVRGTKNARREANRVKSRINVGPWWAFLIRYIVPAAVFIIMIAGLSGH